MGKLLDKLIKIDNQILQGKTAISYALQYAGISAVSPNDNVPDVYETFQSYADKIRRLQPANSMILEFTIPEGKLTKYKRTIVLPMTGISYDNIARELINSDTEYNAVYYSENQDFTEYMGGGRNTFNGNEDEEFINDLKIDEVESRAEESEDEDLPDYQFTVDWGDGTTADYNSSADTAAIYHTYEKGGTYDVAINGFFRVLTNGSNWDSQVQGLYDKDGEIVLSGCNYGMCYYLTKVISWGNTNLRSCQEAFVTCQKLSQIPMYDTTNSFENVTNCSSMFWACQQLKEIPYDSNAERGLFSGCKKVKSYYNLFAGCSGLKGEIPVKLVENSTECTNVSGMFSGCTGLSGGLPVGMFDGMPNLDTASNLFFNCKNLVDTLPERLFPNNPKITTIARLFEGCTNISGNIGPEFIGSLSNLTNMRRAFYNCSKISSISPDAFSGLTKDNLICDDAFYNSGIESIPAGLLESLTGSNLRLVRMFSHCSKLTSIPNTVFSSFDSVREARGMFDSCTSLTSELPTPPPNGDWDNIDNIRKWYGLFSRCSKMTNYSSIPMELGGRAVRKYPERKVGAIVLADKSIVDITDYEYNSSNKPVGVVYAHNSDNIVRFMALTNRNTAWTDANSHVSDTPITNKSSSSNWYYWGDYTGKENTNAIVNWSRYKEHPEYYPAFKYCHEYSTDGFPAGTWFFGSGSDVWDIYSQIGMMQDACDEIVKQGGFTSSTCFASTNSQIWCSNEKDSVQAWAISTSYFNAGGGKWQSTRNVIPVSTIQL